MPGSSKLSWGPLSPNACRGLGCWYQVSWQIGFSSWQRTATALLHGWPVERGELTSLLLASGGTCGLLSAVLGADRWGLQVRAPWSPALAGNQSSELRDSLMNTCGGSSDTSLSSWRTVVGAVGTNGACERDCCRGGLRGPMGRGVVP